MTRRYSWRRVLSDLRDGFWSVSVDLRRPIAFARWGWHDAQYLQVRLYPVTLCIGWAAGPRFDDPLDEETPA